MTFKCSNCSDPIEITEAELLALEKDAQTVDTGTGEVIDVCAAPTFQIGSQDYDQCPFCLKPVMFVAYQSHLAKCREAYGDPNMPCDCECDPLACPRHGKRNWDAMSKDSSKP